MGQAAHVGISIYLWPTMSSNKCIVEELSDLSLVMDCQSKIQGNNFASQPRPHSNYLEGGSVS